MQDGILKGTGNSRYLKSIADFLTQYPTYEDMVAALVAGTLPIDLNGINTAGWSQVPTYLNKANLLSDTTETAIWGDTGNRTVDAALAELGAGVNTLETSKGNASVVTGSYSGSGSTSKTLNFSAPPKAVLIATVMGTAAYAATFVRSASIAPWASYVAGSVNTGLTWSGNSLKFSAPSGGNASQAQNVSGSTYYYCALL